MKRVLHVILLSAVCLLTLGQERHDEISVPAREQFVTFQASQDALPLKGGLTYDDREAMPVKRAVASLRQDFLRVTGSELGESQSTIVVGTVGCNRQIDQWVRQGQLRDLKGKCEKYIIKTIGNQLVIAGSDKRGTVYGIYELSRHLPQRRGHERGSRHETAAERG